MRRIIFSFCLVLMVCISVKSQSLSDLVNDKETLLVDVRTPEEFAEGSVENSINIPVQILQNHIEELRGKKNIVVFCRRGIRAEKAIQILKDNGIENVVNGGTWEKVKDLVEPKKK